MSKQRVAELLEALVSDAVCPDGGADRFADKRSTPATGLSGIGAVTLQVRRLEGRVAREVLTRESHEVLLNRAEIGASEVDDSHLAVVQKPVPRLPIAMRGHDAGRSTRPGRDLVSDAALNFRVDPMRLIEEALDAPTEAIVPVGV